MRKRHSYIAVLFAGMFATLTLVGCGKADNVNPKPEDYIQLGTYKGLEYVKPSGEVTEEDIQEELSLLASAYATEETLTEGKVESGDTANIDYEGKLDGVAFDGGTAAGYDLKIGSHNFIDGFEDGLIGVSVGDTVDLNLTFPENYGSADLAGKSVVFTVKVNWITRTILPEITDELISEISQGQFDNVDAYKEMLVEQMKMDNEDYIESMIYNDLLDMAVENVTILKDIPQEYIQSKVSRMLVNAQDYAQAYGVDFETFVNEYMGMTKDEYNAQAIEYANGAAVKSLVIQAIAAAEGLSISDSEFEEAVNDYVSLYGYESAEQFKSETNMDDFKEYILTSKVEEFLYNNAVITEE